MHANVYLSLFTRDAILYYSAVYAIALCLLSVCQEGGRRKHKI